MRARFHRDHRSGGSGAQRVKAFLRRRHRLFGHCLAGGIKNAIRAPAVSQIQSHRVIFSDHKGVAALATPSHSYWFGSME